MRRLHYIVKPRRANDTFGGYDDPTTSWLERHVRGNIALAKHRQQMALARIMHQTHAQAA